ncbi:hypothetical protein A9J41_04990 [Laribacter hongkongensis]|nr:hypothetical protein [Laribacter hongkongensis]
MCNTQVCQYRHKVSSLFTDAHMQVFKLVLAHELHQEKSLARCQQVVAACLTSASRTPCQPKGTPSIPGMLLQQPDDCHKARLARLQSPDMHLVAPVNLFLPCRQRVRDGIQ